MNSRSIFCFGMLVSLTSLVNSARISIIPDGFIEGVTDSVLVTCSLDGTGTRATQILVVEISKDGATPIAHIMPVNKIILDNQKGEHYEIRGLANNSDIPNTHINLTINYPSKEDAGKYKCVMSYLDETGLVKQDTDEAELRLNSSDTSDVEIRINNLEAAMDNLLQRIKDAEKVNEDLKSENKNQSVQIDLLKEKTDFAVGFSAAIGSATSITAGEVLVFGDVITNEGQGYNSSTGIFTAPKAGLYAFHLVVEIGQAGAVSEICLNVAGKDLAKVYTQDKDFGDQGATSVVTRLAQGAMVKAVVIVVHGNSPQVFSERLCVFSGFLIKP